MLPVVLAGLAGVLCASNPKKRRAAKRRRNPPHSTKDIYIGYFAPYMGNVYVYVVLWRTRGDAEDEASAARYLKAEGHGGGVFAVDHKLKVKEAKAQIAEKLKVEAAKQYPKHVVVSQNPRRAGKRKNRR